MEEKIISIIWFHKEWLADVAQLVGRHPYTKRLQFLFLGRAHTWVSGLIPVWGVQKAVDQSTLHSHIMFLSFLSPFSPSKNQ